jgi:hypothetical protein
MRLAGAISPWFATKIGSRELPKMKAKQFDAWCQRRHKTLPRPAALTQLSFGRYFAGLQHQEAAANALIWRGAGDRSPRCGRGAVLVLCASPVQDLKLFEERGYVGVECASVAGASAYVQALRTSRYARPSTVSISGTTTEHSSPSVHHRRRRRFA